MVVDAIEELLVQIDFSDSETCGNLINHHGVRVEASTPIHAVAVSYQVALLYAVVPWSALCFELKVQSEEAKWTFALGLKYGL